MNKAQLITRILLLFLLLHLLLLLLLFLGYFAQRWSARFRRLLAELSLIARKHARAVTTCMPNQYQPAITHTSTRMHAHTQSTFLSLNDGVVKTGGAMAIPSPSCCVASASIPPSLPPLAPRVSGISSICARCSCRCHCITAPTSFSSCSLTYPDRFFPVYFRDKHR
jgi:hypothetical protein